MTVHIDVLFLVNTATKILTTGLEIATALGLPTTTWRTGDPEPSLYKYLAEVLAAHDGQVASYIKAGFLQSAIDDANESGSDLWLRYLAEQTFGVTVPDAGYATPTVTLENTGGGDYPRLAGEITVRNSATGKTYHNTNAPAPLSAGTSVTYELEADEPGSSSGVAANEIDEIVTTMLGVEVTSSTAGFARDAPTPDEVGTLCRATLGALSPNGPPDAYEYVCLSSELTGTTEITRAYSYAESTAGRVQVYVASASGPVSAGGLLACQDAVEQWATPLCIRPTVSSASAQTVDVTATVAGDFLPTDWAERVASGVSGYLASVPIHGTVARSAILAAMHKAAPQIALISMSEPAADVVLGVDEVATPGDYTLTEA